MKKLSGSYLRFVRICALGLVASLDCVCIKTIILFIPALGYLLFLEASVDGLFLHLEFQQGFFFGTGLAISAPLLLFGVAAHRLRFPPLVYVNTSLLPLHCSLVFFSIMKIFQARRDWDLF